MLLLTYSNLVNFENKKNFLYKNCVNKFKLFEYEEKIGLPFKKM